MDILGWPKLYPGSNRSRGLQQDIRQFVTGCDIYVQDEKTQTLAKKIAPTQLVSSRMLMDRFATYWGSYLLLKLGIIL